MKVNDSAIGFVLLLLSIAILWHVRNFPDIPGQEYGASLFPTMSAAALAVCSLLLILSGVKSKQPLVKFNQGTTSNSLFSLIVTLIVLFGYALFVDYLGFYITAGIGLFVLMCTYGVKLKVAVFISLATTLIIHAIFYKLLGVPLPWGLLTPYAW